MSGVGCRARHAQLILPFPSSQPGGMVWAARGDCGSFRIREKGEFAWQAERRGAGFTKLKTGDPRADQWCGAAQVYAL